MNELVKKWIIRFLIVELIANIAFFSITPYLFGAIKPFNPQAIKEITRTGILEKSNYGIHMQGSYKLKSGQKITLISTKKNLDAYLGKKVSIQGLLKKTEEGQVKIIDGPTINKQLDIISLKSIKAAK